RQFQLHLALADDAPALAATAGPTPEFRPTLSAAPPNTDEVTETDAPPAAPAPAAPGADVAGYELLGELGRGGMGVVCKARDRRLGRVVALKMVLAGAHAGPAELVRFLTEAEAVAAVNHPGIVGIFEVGSQDGLPWFALEFCPGGSLAQKLAG